MSKQKQNDILYEAILEVSVAQAFENETDTLPPINELNERFQPSPELSARIKRLIEKDKREKRLAMFMKKARKAAACIAVVFTLAAVTLFSVEASRNYILNAVLDWQKGSTGIRFEETSSAAEDCLYQPTYLPEGFREVLVQKGGITIITYENREGTKIWFNQNKAKYGDTFIDNDHTEYSEVTIDDKKAYLFKAVSEDTSNTLIWENGGIAFSLCSVIDSKELIKIAESLKKY
ncbi:DUF4367 domain-containing protein [Acetanaerobacterium elongatum]|uniref:DUF4367 domain-containing protein n=1 Tax=Acetanaerobacterium elongatum TaxID=258515 RepID=A0A1H0GFA6_9FIRM|nr:DUF4367 domain-containing protein [Acetanaerobacterium elongatum]SDO05580.1 protein of unknown function [Acetanaerobacterium elongatum]